MRPKKFLSALLVSLLLLFNSPLIALADDATAPTDANPTTQQDTTAPASDGSTSQPPADQTTTPPPADQTTPPPASSTDTTTSSTPTPPATASPQTTTTTAPAPAPQYPPKPKYAYVGQTNRWIDINQLTLYWDPLSGHWQSPYYRYDAFLDRYWVLTSAEVAANQAAEAQRQQTAATLNQLFGTDPLNSGNGAGSTNNASLTNINNALLQLASLATINNNQNSNALSGDASANENVGGAMATTGLASVVSNLLNIINSALSWGGGGLTTFVKNIFGDHTGDITINPVASNSGSTGQIGSFNPAAGGVSSNQGNGADSTNTATTTNQNDLTIVNKPSGTINNNLGLLAQSGNAEANQNVGGANATSGNALVDLNILNLINSVIGAGDMFVGMLNVFGNLNGDILFPTGFLDSVSAGSPSTGGSQASNIGNGAGSTNNADINSANNTTINNNPSALFNNNINLAAGSGSATTNENVGGAAATTGDAKTTSNLFNFFNNNLFGDNAVLVFVNVMGHWVGGIMNLPSNPNGTEAGLLTGNATVSNVGNGADSTNNASVNNTNNTNITNSPTGVINNNITAGAYSGNATANENVDGAKATSGDATVFSNVANFFGSQLNLKKFFGVMFINIFGDWTGKVNEDTAAGNSPVVAQTNGTNNSGSENTTTHSVSHATNSSGVSSGSTTGGGQSVNNSAIHSNLSAQNAAAKASYDAAVARTKSMWPTLIAIFAAFALLLAAGLSGLERKLGGRL